jgi:hypothetical protein
MADVEGGGAAANPEGRGAVSMCGSAAWARQATYKPHSAPDQSPQGGTAQAHCSTPYHPAHDHEQPRPASTAFTPRQTPETPTP